MSVTPMQELLTAAGMSADAASSRALLFARADKRLADRDGLRRFWVPGRVEVLGKHVDYGGGSSLVAAIERGFCTVAAPRDDGKASVTDLATGQSVEFEFDPDLEMRGGWATYVATVVRRLARDLRGPWTGLDIAFVSDLPPAAGMSSSSALIIATYLAIAGVNRLDRRGGTFTCAIQSPVDLASYLACVESGQAFGPFDGDRGVGTFGGSQDHAAILGCRADSISQFAYCPLRLEREIPMPSGQVFVIGASGVEAVKTAGAMDNYNRASHRLREVLGLWNEHSGRADASMAEAIASAPDAADRLSRLLRGQADPSLLYRFVHFQVESTMIVSLAARALLNGDLRFFGRLTDHSQNLAEEFLGNQIRETIFLARAARETGATAASAFGAGFGGSVWAMIPENQVADFIERWRRAYLTAFPQHAANAIFFATRPGPPAFELTSLP
jgi:galactokinase